eukprot:SRR837773.4446.p1 GENE.SRR837773.4446~~SRR837773.4446.p1  ORF type:complete len:158 (+),score=57.27 SRR837773.4446:236-709(+)
MNFALNERDGEALVVFPLAYTLGMLSQILMGEVVFQELEAFTSVGQQCLFWGGAAFLILCIVVHTEAKVAVIQSLIDDAEKEIEEAGREQLPPSPAWRRRAASHALARKSSLDSEASIVSWASVKSSGPFDPGAYPESFGQRPRVYTVSIMGPIGIA